MEINQLIILVEQKIREVMSIETISIEDKSFLHKNHIGNEKNKFHLKISIQSKAIENLTKVEATKIIYKAISKEMSDYIHSVQLSINQ
tara:strand:- start:1498 stop:1761 length:264 start_codon:yes stop_codon:yes gene_type:complete